MSPVAVVIMDAASGSCTPCSIVAGVSGRGRRAVDVRHGAIQKMAKIVRSGLTWVRGWRHLMGADHMSVSQAMKRVVMFSEVAGASCSSSSTILCSR